MANISRFAFLLRIASRMSAILRVVGILPSKARKFPIQAVLNVIFRLRRLIVQIPSIAIFKREIQALIDLSDLIESGKCLLTEF